MLHCKACHTDIAGNHERCPLCGGSLAGEAEEHRSYPVIPPNPNRTRRLIQIISLAAVAAAVASVAINILIPTRVWWSLFAAFGLLCGWLWAVVGLVKKAKLLNNIVWELVLISALAFVWDWLTGWRGWSVEYVFPSVCTGAMLAVIILSRVLRMPDRDYLIYLVLCAILGIIPVIFLLLGIPKMMIPSVLCVAVSLIVIAMLLIFYWKPMYREITKKLHL